MRTLVFASTRTNVKAQSIHLGVAIDHQKSCGAAHHTKGRYAVKWVMQQGPSKCSPPPTLCTLALFQRQGGAGRSSIGRKTRCCKSNTARCISGTAFAQQHALSDMYGCDRCDMYLAVGHDRPRPVESAPRIRPAKIACAVEIKSSGRG